MKKSTPFDYQRYLLAKRTVDARALNLHVWGTIVKALADVPQPVQVLELGAGVGSMAMQFLEKSLLNGADYTLVDQIQENLTAAKESLSTSDKNSVRFDFFSEDVYAFLERNIEKKWDLLIGHALLDLLDIPTAIPRLLAALKPGGLFYFPINYDGLSIFLPKLNAEFEASLLTAYHRTMDERIVNGLPSGDSQTGRHLLTGLPAAGAQILAAGSSDWVVLPKDGTYPSDEAYFLECILLTIENALTNFPGLDQTRLKDWIEERKNQLAMRELIYIAHQIDILGILPRVE